MSLISISRRFSVTSPEYAKLETETSLVPYTEEFDPQTGLKTNAYPSIYNCTITDFHLRLVANSIYRSDEADDIDPNNPPANLHLVLCKLPQDQTPQDVNVGVYNDFHFNPLYSTKLLYKDTKNIFFSSMVDSSQIYDLFYSTPIRLNRFDDIRLIVSTDMPIDISYPDEGEPVPGLYPYITVDYSFEVQYNVKFS